MKIEKIFLSIKNLLKIVKQRN